MTFAWAYPEENWSKLPHQFIDEAMPNINSLSELKVILYILRHTWGRGDDEKKITVDEFEKGRKNKSGERIDNGVGMSRNSIKSGLSLAQKHGYITIIKDNSDMARQKRIYRLSNLEDQKLTPRGSEVDPQLSKVDPRSEKETKKKETKESNTPSTDDAVKEIEESKPVEKPARKRDPLFDAVSEHIFEIDPSQGVSNGGRIAIIANWLNGKRDCVNHGRTKIHVGAISKPAKPEHVKMFAEWYKQNNSASIPLDAEKFVTHWRKWATAMNKQSVTAPSTLDYSDYEAKQRAIQEAWNERSKTAV